MLVETKARGLKGFLVTWLGSAAAVAFSAWLLPGVEVRSFGAALLTAVVLSLVNALVRPFLVLLTLPITLITLGLFLLVINAAVVGIAAWLVPGFSVQGFVPALLMSLVMAFVSTVLSWLFAGDARSSRSS